MALSDVLGPIRRRWYILLVGLLLAAGMGWATAVLAPSQYTARGLVMLLPSQLTTGPKGNPLLNLGGLELPARVLIAYYSSEPAKSDLEKFAPKAEVTVSMEESTRGPIIAVDVTDVTADGAMSVLQHVTDSIPENLARIQNSVNTAKQAAVGSMPLVLDNEAERDISGTVRLVLASVVAMLALTFFVLFSLDGIMLRPTTLDAEDSPEVDDNQIADETEIATGDSIPDARDEPGLIMTTESESPIIAKQGDPAPTPESAAPASEAHQDVALNGALKAANGTDFQHPSSVGSSSTATGPGALDFMGEDSPGEADSGSERVSSESDDTRTSRALA